MVTKCSERCELRAFFILPQQPRCRQSIDEFGVVVLSYGQSLPSDAHAFASCH